LGCVETWWRASGCWPSWDGGQIVTGASSGHSGVGCSVGCAGVLSGIGVPVRGEGASRSTSVLVRKSSSVGDGVRCLEKGKVISS